MHKKHIQKKKGKSPLKKITGFLHLWLGLVSGLVVFVVCLSGTLFVFCDEVIDAFGGKAKFVEARPHNKLSEDTLVAKFRQQYPYQQPIYFDSYRERDRSFRIAAEEQVHNNDKKSGRKKRGPLSYFYINPYTAKIISQNKSYEFFYLMAHLHAQLLSGKLGKTVVGISSIIFFFQLIGGFILWWPKKWNKNTRTAAFKIKSGTKWRRKNYDLHNVLGFYAVLPAMFLTITGLIMAYEFLGNVTQKTFGGDPKAIEILEQMDPKYNPSQKPASLEAIAKNMFAMGEDIRQVRSSIPSKEDDSVTVLFGTTGRYIGLKSKLGGESFMIDKYSGKRIIYPEIVNTHDKIERTNFDLHVGYWGGMVGKLFTFIVGIIGTSLPVTGFLIWWGRKFKTKKALA